ncbi:MAG: hypothetical protein ISR25_02530 [Candidatus Poseidoniaceae archaeon]|nr:hypothetical protein [Candidatus Poseidoniaceae archaeon]
MDQLKKILNPKIWLILTALIHAVVGIILETDWSDDPQVLIGGFMLLTSVTMLYIAFFMHGQEQARLTAVIAGPAWVWFVVSAAMGLTWQIGSGDSMEMTFAGSIPPLIIWGLTALSGVLHGNFQDMMSGTDAVAEATE